MINTKIMKNFLTKLFSPFTKGEYWGWLVISILVGILLYTVLNLPFMMLMGWCTGAFISAYIIAKYPKN